MDANELAKLRHSASHVMAHAVRNLFPGVKIAIGPAIEDGFYYDFDVPHPFAPEDLEKITAEMKRIVKTRAEFVRREVTRDEALAMFKDEPYKLELIRDLPEGEAISVYTEGDFTDLCRGPHVANTGEIGAYMPFKVR